MSVFGQDRGGELRGLADFELKGGLVKRYRLNLYIPGSAGHGNLTGSGLATGSCCNSCLACRKALHFGLFLVNGSDDGNLLVIDLPPPWHWKE